MKKTFLIYLPLALIFLIPVSLKAQNITPKKRFTFYDLYPWQGQKGYSVGMTYYSRPALDVGIFCSDVPKKNNQWTMANQLLFLNTEFTFNLSNPVIAPKIGYEINYVYLTGRISNICYYEFNKNSFDNRILIEGGVSLFGHANLCYGYSIPSLSGEIRNLERHRICLKLNFFPDL